MTLATFFTHWLPRPAEADRKAPGVFAWHYVTPEGAEPEQTLPIKLLPDMPAFTAPKRIACACGRAGGSVASPRS